MNSIRQTIFIAIYLAILLILTEVLLRSALLFFDYDFIKPSDSIYTKFFASLRPFVNADIRSDDQITDILILGGSVVSPVWSKLDTRLDSILTEKYPGRRNFAVYNAAMPAHTSLDNLLKYELLKDQRFDLVIFYEAINENRANNITSNLFKADYSHIKWYQEIRLLKAHPEMDWSVIPYVLDKLTREIKDILSRKEYIHYQGVDTRYVAYGKNIKTASSYRTNLSDIIALASSRQDRLLLLTYADYFPPGVKLTGDSTDRLNFSKCAYSTSASLWGDPDNVRKGISVHNKVLRDLAGRNKLLFLDMAEKIPKEAAFFCDICHLSEAGAQKFAVELADFLIENKVFN